MVLAENKMFSLLSEPSQIAVNDFIEFLYNKENETERVIKEAFEGKNLVGPFDTVEDLMRDLYAED